MQASSQDGRLVIGADWLVAGSAWKSVSGDSGKRLRRLRKEFAQAPSAVASLPVASKGFDMAGGDLKAAYSSGER
ncbi:hypothetical protein ACP4OV_025246 [Aristida adscensionis]